MTSPKPERGELVASLADLMTSGGSTPRIDARVLCLLLFSGDEGRTQQEICSELGVSAGHVSTSLRALADRRFVERILVLGERRARYRTVPDMWRKSLLADIPRMQAMVELAESAKGTPGLDEGVGPRLEAMSSVVLQLIAALEQL